jgi:putative membrane protein
LGLFLFVINAVVFYLADWMLDGIATTGFTAALLASLMYSAAAVVIDAALQRVFRED